ncbi:MAG: hypothetical protein RL134_1060 [Actinomycetota bacterium]|jgi:hypothetical protein
MYSMSRRLREHVVRRPSLPLTAKDQAELESLRQSPALLDSLSRLSSSPSPIEANVSEALVLHALLQVGMATVRAEAISDGYAELAADYAASAPTRRSVSRRRAPVWADEA